MLGDKEADAFRIGWGEPGLEGRARIVLAAEAKDQDTPGVGMERVVLQDRSRVLEIVASWEQP